MALFYQSPTRNLPDGYTFYGATQNDIPVITYLLNQMKISSPNACNFSFEELRNGWKESNLNPALDVRLVFDQREQLAGYIEVWVNTSLAAQPLIWGCVHPGYEGRGIGTAMLRWAEARVRLTLELIPANQRLAPRLSILNSLPKAPSLCQALGWRLLSQAQSATPRPNSLIDLVQLARYSETSARPVYDIYEKELRP